MGRPPGPGEGIERQQGRAEQGRRGRLGSGRDVVDAEARHDGLAREVRRGAVEDVELGVSWSAAVTVAAPAGRFAGAMEKNAEVQPAPAGRKNGVVENARFCGGPADSSEKSSRRLRSVGARVIRSIRTPQTPAALKSPGHR